MLESFCLSWKEPCKLEKDPAKLERTKWTFQLQPELSNFGRNFRTSIFPSSFRTFQLLFLSSCPFQLHVSHLSRSPSIADWLKKCCSKMCFFIVIISVRSTKRKCEITKKAICMSFVLVIIIVALSLALYFKSKMHFQNTTDQSELSACNETVPNCNSSNGRIINGTFTTEHPPIRFAKKDS